MTEHGMDPEPFLKYVHEIDVGLVDPNPDLALKLGLLPGRKLIFTNSSRLHAKRVMERIGITEHFEEIFDISDADYIPKPDRTSYTMMLRRHGVTADSACMIDDIPVNLETAKAVGMTTVWAKGVRDWGPSAPKGQILTKIDFVAEDLCTWLDAVLARRSA
jgi:putative hydrolase of the HAD superfamily